MKKKNRGGRPRKLTLAKVKAVAEWIGMGMPEEDACLLEDVNPQTWDRAKKAPEFCTVVKRARARFMGEALKVIRAGGEIEVIGTTESGSPITRTKPWQGAAWILERRHKPHFNRTETVAKTDNEGRPIFTKEDLGELEKMGREMTLEHEEKVRRK